MKTNTDMDGSEIKRILGTSVFEIRRANDLSQQKLAELIGKDKNTINRIEFCVNFVTSDTYAILCNIFNVHPSILMMRRPAYFLKEHVNYRNKINELLKTFSVDKLQEIYNILSVMNK